MTPSALNLPLVMGELAPTGGRRRRVGHFGNRRHGHSHALRPADVVPSTRPCDQLLVWTSAGWPGVEPDECPPATWPIRLRDRYFVPLL